MLKRIIGCFTAAQFALNPVQSRISSDSLADRVEFQTFELDGEIDDMMWCGQNDEVILVKTDDGSIYRSRDRGGNWKRLKSLMIKQGAQVADES